MSDCGAADYTQPRYDGIGIEMNTMLVKVVWKKGFTVEGASVPMLSRRILGGQECRTRGGLNSG